MILAGESGYAYDASVGRAYLLVIGDAAALAWVLHKSRMAFPEARRRQVEALSEGDELFIYTARGCFNNPTRDRGKIIGYATVAGPAVELDEPVTIRHRTFELGCRLDIAGVAPLRTGVELAPLVPQLDAFPDPKSWSARLRRPPLPLTATDADLLHALLDQLIEPLTNHLPDYLQQAHLPGPWARHAVEPAENSSLHSKSDGTL